MLVSCLRSRPHIRDHFSTVAAVYDRRFYGMLHGKPAVIDRRYSRKARVDGIEFVNEFLAIAVTVLLFNAMRGTFACHAHKNRT